MTTQTAIQNEYVAEAVVATISRLCASKGVVCGKRHFKSQTCQNQCDATKPVHSRQGSDPKTQCRSQCITGWYLGAPQDFIFLQKTIRAIKSYKTIIKGFEVLTILIIMRRVEQNSPSPSNPPDSRALLHFCLAPSVSELVDTTDFKDDFESLSFSRDVRAQGLRGF